MINASRTGLLRQTSGVRVRNALATYRGVGAILSKERPIPPTLGDLMVIEESAKGQFFSALCEGPASYQLVGGVTASQGEDG